MSRHILYVSYDGMTDTLGQSQVLPYICGLTKHGYEFSLISCEKKEKYAANRHIIDKICSSNHIDWHPIVYHKSPPILSTIYDVWILQRSANQIHRKKSISLVHCRGYISALIGLNLKRKNSIPFLFDMRGLWADEKVDAGAWNQSKWMYKLVYEFFKLKEKQFFLEADHTVSLTKAGKEEIMTWDYMQDRSADKISIIPCCADIDHFSPVNVDEIEKEKWRTKLALGYHMVSYLGSIGTWYMLDEMLDFFVVYRSKFEDAKMLFITFDEHDRIRDAARQRGLESHIVIQGAQRQEVPTLLSLSTVSLFFIRPTYSKISSSPTKQAEIMAMGIPVVCNKGVGDTDRILEHYQAGIGLSEFTNKSYEIAIEQLGQASWNSQAIRAGAIEYFSLDQGVITYAKIYQDIMSV